MKSRAAEGCLDISDTGSTRVEFLQPDGSFCHEHPCVLFLEYAELSEDDPRKDVLKIASELLRGTESSLEALACNCERYASRNGDLAEDIITERAQKLDADFKPAPADFEKLSALNEKVSRPCVAST